MAHAVAAQRPSPSPAPEYEYEKVQVKVRKGRMYYDGLLRHKEGSVVTVVASVPKGKKLGEKGAVIGKDVLLWAAPLDGKPAVEAAPAKAGDAAGRRGVI